MSSSLGNTQLLVGVASGYTSGYNVDISGNASLSTGSSSNTYKNLYGKAPPTNTYLSSVTPNTTNATSASWINNNITWTSSASTTYPGGYDSYKAFDNTNSTTYNSAAGTYPIFGLPVGTTVTNAYNTTTSSFVSLSGDWIQIQSSIPLTITSYQLGTGNNNLQFLKTYYIVGSNDGNSWNIIQYGAVAAAPASASTLVSTVITATSAVSASTYGTSTITTSIYGSATTSPYIYYRIICASTISGTTFELSSWNITFSVPTVTGPSRSLLYMDPSNINQLDVSGSLALVNTAPTMTVTPNNTAVTSYTWQNNNVTWLASASSVYTTGTSPWYAFSNNNAGWFAAGSTTYTVGTGLYAGSVATTTVSGIGSGVSGEWLQLTSSVPIVLNSYTMTTAAGITCSRCPASFTIAGSNDGSTWYAIQNVNTTALPSYFSTSSTSSQTTAKFIVGNSPTTPQNNATITGYSTSSNAYTYFRIFVQLTFGTRFSIASGDGYLSFVFSPVFTPVTSSISMALDNGIPNQLNIGGTLSLGSGYSATTNGWTTLPGGIILQWGTVNLTLSVNSTATATVTLPTPFKSVIFNAVAQISDPGVLVGYLTTGVGVYGLSLTTITILAKQTNGYATGVGIYWQALGM